MGIASWSLYMMGLGPYGLSWGTGSLEGSNRGGTVTNCYSTGAVIGASKVGGLLGYQRPSSLALGDVTYCFWDTQTSGQTTSAGGTGKTTAEMKMAGTFLDAGWDFVGETTNGTQDIWWILESQDYPRLSWELLPADEDVNLLFKK
jgi:hypothetical protein